MEHLCTDAHDVVFSMLTLQDLLALRGCTHVLYELLSPANARALWVAVGQHARLRQRLSRVLHDIPMASAAEMFMSIWPAVTNQPPKYFEAALRHACARQWVSKARWLIANGRIRPTGVWHGDDSALAIACSGGHTEIVELLIKSFAIPLRRLLTGHRHHIVGKPRARTNRFRDACAGGHLATAQWLVSHFGLTSEDHHEGLLEALDAVGMAGHLHVAEWLVDQFPFRHFDLRTPLIYACNAGHRDLAVWLIRSECIGVSLHDLSCRLMCDLCKAGHTEIAQELTRHCALASDAKYRMPYTSMFIPDPAPSSEVMNWLAIACRAQHFATADWLVTEFGLERNLVLRELYRAADYSVIDPTTDWLLRRYSITIRELNSMLYPSQSGFYKIAKS